jgi:hypothetical protein
VCAGPFDSCTKSMVEDGIDDSGGVFIISEPVNPFSLFTINNVVYCCGDLFIGNVTGVILRTSMASSNLSWQSHGRGTSLAPI